MTKLRALPAIDLREGACVQLVGGRYDDERVRLPDPLEASQRWADAGLRVQHIVDLDAAVGRGSNSAVVARLASQKGVEIQVGGGVRDDAAIEALLSLGVARVVVGTRAVEDEKWLVEASERFPRRLILAADVLGRKVVTRGWQTTTALSLDALLDRVAGLPLAGILVTAVHVEGQLAGTDLSLMRDAVAASTAPLIASGGVTTMEDLRQLEAAGVSAAVVGMALYTGRLDPLALAKEFSP
jgi:phosphoribosylformimino-5-aminoimidazole carboxamide ribotide isomerase